jgi:serine O-acetyltransferase
MQRFRALLSRCAMCAHLPLAAFALRTPCRELILSDAGKWLQYLDIVPCAEQVSERETVAMLLARDPAFRTLLYYRLKHGGELTSALVPFLKRIWRPLASLDFHPDSLGPGCFILHGWNTSVSARSIGADFVIGVNVMVGFSKEGEYPTIGDNVCLSVGSIVLGDILLDDNSVVGAGAVVVRDVPTGATVVGVPAKPMACAEPAPAIS